MTSGEVSLTAGWLKEISHLAGHAALPVDENLSNAARALKDARRNLEDAIEAIEAAGPAADHVQVRMV
ncbi:MAG: hypothetical protein LBJ07_02485 [Actinomycetes bacterium]|nr:hypothetical protein [Actinomycetes bacterium]